MRPALLALALTIPAAGSALPAESPTDPPQRPERTAALAPLCNDGTKARPAMAPGGMKPRRLGELPPADLTLTVLNRVGECIEPLIVRQGYGHLDRPAGR